VLLAGGRARRLGGLDKAELTVSGRRMLDRVLDALAAADPVVVVGPRRTTERSVRWTREDPPGAGPLAALAAGLAILGRFGGVVAVLAVDLVAVRPTTVARLRAALDAAPDADGAVLVDGDSRVQWLLGVWRADALRKGLSGRAVGGGSLHSVLGALPVIRVAEVGDESSDIDTDSDLRRWSES
jgi:molybdenum cofactor guanylyltransferase